MGATYVAIIKGPKEYLAGGMLIQKFEVTDEAIAEYLDEAGPGQNEEHAITYYMGDYTDEWEQRFCTVTFLTEDEFNSLYDEAGEVIKDEVNEPDPLDEWEELKEAKLDIPLESWDDNPEYRTFSLSKKEYDKYNDWRKSKGEVYVGSVGGAYTFCFTPTGIGTIVTVKCADGTELDLTDYDLF